MQFTSPGQNSSIERREYRRYVVDKEKYFLTAPIHTEPIGQLVDISQRGLSFVYFVNIDKEVFESDTINVIGLDFEICINALQYRNVNDLEVTGSYPAFRANKRRRGIEFKKRTRKQKREIMDLIHQIQLGRQWFTPN